MPFLYLNKTSAVDLREFQCTLKLNGVNGVRSTCYAERLKNKIVVNYHVSNKHRKGRYKLDRTLIEPYNLFNTGIHKQNCDGMSFVTIHSNSYQKTRLEARHLTTLTN